MYVTKRPHNTIEGPVYPFIQKDPPRFYKTKKFWQAHPDDIIRGQADNTQLLDGSILAVSRNENQTRYGQRSYTPKVNKEFRPPLVDPEYDLTPLSRLNRPRTQMRINPESLAGTQNIHGTDVSSFIDTRVLHAAVRPSYTILMEKPLDNSILPDLKLNLPQVCGESRINVPVSLNQHSELTLRQKDNPTVILNSGYTNVYTGRNQTSLEDLDLDYNGPQVSGASGMNVTSVYHERGETPIENLSLDYHNPQVIGRSGAKGITSRNNTHLENTTLTHHNPQVGVASGIANTYQSKININENMQLDYNMPQTSLEVNPQSNISTRTAIQSQQAIKTQSPIKIDYSLTPIARVDRNNTNTTPKLRPTLDYDRCVGASCSIPQNFKSQDVKLKDKISHTAPVKSTLYS